MVYKYQLHFFVKSHTVNPSLNQFWGAYLFQTPFQEELLWQGGLFHLQKLITSVVHKQLGYKVETLLKVQEVWRSSNARITIKSKLPVGK